jgi:hypothetical protein
MYRVRIRVSEMERYTIGETTAVIGVILLVVAALGFWALVGG